MLNFNEEFLKLEEDKNTLKKLKTKLSNIDLEIIKTNTSLKELKKILSKEEKDEITSKYLKKFKVV